MGVPIEAVIGLCTGLLSIIGGLILWYLTKLLNEVNDLKTELKSLEVSKVDKQNLDLRLESIITALANLTGTITEKFALVLSGQEEIKNDLSGFGKRVDERLEDHDRQLAEIGK